MGAESGIDDRTDNSAQGQSRQSTEDMTITKKCPYCAEQIQVEAVKCRYCGEFLLDKAIKPKPRRKKWYFSTPSVVIALLCLGPLALPLVWFNPHYKPTTKTVISTIVLVVTGLCMYLMAIIYRQLLSQFQELGI